MNFFIFSSIVAAITCELLGGFVFLKNPKSNINRSFAIETFFIGIWTLFPFLTSLPYSYDEALFSARLVYMSAMLVPPTFLLFVFNLLNIVHIKRERNTLRLFYLCTIVFLVYSFSPLFIEGIHMSGLLYTIKPGLIYHLFFLYFGLTIVYGYIRIFLQYQKSTGREKNQLLYILASFLIAGIAGMIHFLSAYGIIEIFPHDILVIVYTAIMAYSIVKYKAMEVNIVFKKTMAYSLSAGLLTGLFVVLVLAITNILSAFTDVSSFKVSIFSALFIAVLFNPLRNRIQAIIDKLFYKKSYDYYAVIRKVSHELSSIFDLSGIYKFTADNIYEVLGLSSIYILEWGKGGYETVYHKSKRAVKGKIFRTETEDEGGKIRIGARTEMVRLCKKTRDIIVADEVPAIELKNGSALSDSVLNDLKPFQGDAVVPIFVDNKLSILIVLGEKLSGDMFTHEDRNLLNTISNQTAVTLKNAGLYKDKVNSERLASIGMMSATFAHEIRNPLTSLKTFAQLMPEKYNDEEFRVTFSKIVEGEIERIDGLIGDLLDYSSEKKSTRLNNFNLVSLVDETVNYVAGKLEMEKRDIEINKKYMEDEIYIAGDTEKLKQTFINILTNGCQAMNGNGVLTVRINQNSRHVEVSVTDTGKGIDPDDISKIFDPFVTNREMGVGLGLAISKRIVEDHNGRIVVKSKLLKGTTFTISLPVQTE